MEGLARLDRKQPQRRNAMDELLKTVQEKTGLDLDQANGAIEPEHGFVKDKLPGPTASQIDGLIG